MYQIEEEILTVDGTIHPWYASVNEAEAAVSMAAQMAADMASPVYQGTMKRYGWGVQLYSVRVLNEGELLLSFGG